MTLSSECEGSYLGVRYIHPELGVTIHQVQSNIPEWSSELMLELGPPAE